MIRNTVKVFLALGLAFLVYSLGMHGCSPTRFASFKTISCDEVPTSFNCVSNPVSPDISPEQAPEYGPEETPVQHYREFIYELSPGKVDILFVIDNSSSMAEEHRSLARQFRFFLRDIRDVNYHIAVITTDISESPKNPVKNAYYQDGKFIPFGNRRFLRNEELGRNPSERVISDFTTAIVREETVNCDRANQPRESRNEYDRYYNNSPTSSTACPSHDERGTYAVNMAIRNNNHSSFFRPEAHFMIIILSDEDIRSSRDYIEQESHEYNFETYAFKPWDQPEVLVESINSRFGAFKTFNVHSIVIPPGNRRCLNEQNRSTNRRQGSGRGYYGEEYARLSRADEELTQYGNGNLLKGSVISICDRNYGSQLSRVALSAQTIRLPLVCGDPADIRLFINNRHIRRDYQIEGRTLIMDPGEIPLNARIKIEVVCPE